MWQWDSFIWWEETHLMYQFHSVSPFAIPVTSGACSLKLNKTVLNVINHTWTCCSCCDMSKCPLQVYYLKSTWFSVTPLTHCTDVTQILLFLLLIWVNMCNSVLFTNLWVILAILVFNPHVSPNLFSKVSFYALRAYVSKRLLSAYSCVMRRAQRTS